ncbi:hypothetical protein [Gordonia hankookensis]|uniref:Integrase n=1 Tax=Gordonia hankookensis TaxID=589403 RepID=A0ABR7WHR3_9ACTN|nr:hypothetical protein [Gordonia hankookensis]MBD1322126.1 hypothetical protein [Gordonia hankookensis]
MPVEIETAAQRVTADHIGATSRDVLYFLDKTKQRVRQDNPNAEIAWPSDRTLRRWLTPLLDAAGLTKTASHRRSESNRPHRAFQPILARHPERDLMASRLLLRIT